MSKSDTGTLPDSVSMVTPNTREDVTVTVERLYADDGYMVRVSGARNGKQRNRVVFFDKKPSSACIALAIECWETMITREYVT